MGNSNEVPQKTKNRVAIWSSNLLLCIYPDKTIIQEDICTPMLRAGLFTIAKMWKQPKCLLTDEWIKNMWWSITQWSMKWVKVTQSCPALCNSMDYTVYGILQARVLEWVIFPFSRGSFQPRSPTLQVDSLPAEPQGKPKNTGVGSLSLLQGTFPTQESNQGLLHCRQILYQLSYKWG